MQTKKVEINALNQCNFPLFTSQLSCDKSQGNHYFVLVTLVAGKKKNRTTCQWI